MNHYYIHGVQN